MGPIHPVWALAAIHPGWGIGILRHAYSGFSSYSPHLAKIRPAREIHLLCECSHQPFWQHECLKIPIPPPRVDSSKGPHRVNRAHWPTKENKHFSFAFFDFFCLWKNGLKWPQIGPGGFFPTNPDLADIFGRTDLNFENSFFFLIFWTPNFWISRFPDLQISGFPGPQISKFPDFQVPRSSRRLRVSLASLGILGSHYLTNSKGPNRVNRAPWPTKENKQNFNSFFDFSGP